MRTIKKYSIILIVITHGAWVICEISCPRTKKSSDYIDQLYIGVSGFNISAAEQTLIEQQGGNSTYGEITYEGVEQLVHKLGLTESDVFYDLGSGVGKMVIQVYLNSPVKKSVGVELGPSRAHAAADAAHKLREEGRIVPGRQLLFYNKNIIDMPLADATVIFMNSLCFSDALMQLLTDKLSELKPGLKVLSTRQLPAHSRFRLVETLYLPMTWNKDVPVYYYQLLE